MEPIMKNLAFLILTTLFTSLTYTQSNTCLSEGGDYLSVYGVFIQSLYNVEGVAIDSLNSSDFMLDDGTIVDVWELKIPQKALFNIESYFMSDGNSVFTPGLLIVEIDEDQNLGDIAAFTETSEGEISIQQEMEAGTYWIGVTSLGGEIGVYELTVSCDLEEDQVGKTRNSAIVVGSNSTATGNLKGTDDENWFRIRLDQAEALTITTTEKSNNLSLYHSHGNPIILDKEVILDAGTYYLKVNNFFGSVDSYTLSITSEVRPGMVTMIDSEGCIDGRYVDDPENNSGLVGDCQGLVAFANEQIKVGLSDKASLVIGLWGRDRWEKIEKWRGVNIYSLPKRVIEVELTDLGLRGEIPPEIEKLTSMARLSLGENYLTGSFPWSFRNRMFDGFVRNNNLSVSGNMIPYNFGPIPETPTHTVRARYHSLAYYQGPLLMEWDKRDDSTPIFHQTPILGRWVALAVRVEHDTEQLPRMITRVLDPSGILIDEALAQATPPITQHLEEEGVWRSEFVFDMPGKLFQTGNQIIHVIDQGEAGELTTDPIIVQGKTPPKFRVVFIPLYQDGIDRNWYKHLDPRALLKGVHDLMPIADDFEARIGPAQKIKGDYSRYDAFGVVGNLWNKEGRPGEFYHGTYNLKTISGFAWRPGQVAISSVSIYFSTPHEFGHNLNLGHTPGCNARGADENYPYSNGLLGLEPVWSRFWRMFIWDKMKVSAEDNIYFSDVMSYCGRRNRRDLSDYHYKKASEYWLNFNDTETSTQMITTQSANTTELDLKKSQRSLALSGSINSEGIWNLGQAELSNRNPRLPDRDSEYELILLDKNGVQLYSEPLKIINVSHDDSSVWAARVPLPLRPPREIMIINPQSEKVLQKQLPELRLNF